MLGRGHSNGGHCNLCSLRPACRRFWRSAIYMGPVKEIAATTWQTLLVDLLQLILVAFSFTELPVSSALYSAQIVQLVSRVKVARVAVGAQIAHIKNTRPVQMKQTVGIAMTAVGTGFRLDVVFLIREIQQDIVQGVMMDNLYTVHGPDHAKIAVRAPGVSTYPVSYTHLTLPTTPYV